MSSVTSLQSWYEAADVTPTSPVGTTAPVVPENMMAARCLSISSGTSSGGCSEASSWTSICSPPAAAARPKRGGGR